MDVSTKDGAFRFTGDFDDSNQAWVMRMIAAMQEGLEANGFDVRASVTLTTTVSLTAD